MNSFKSSFCVFTVFAATAAFGQNPPAPPTAPAGRAVRTMAAVRATSPLKIDGHLDDAAWQAATPSSDFTVSFPKAGATPSERSEVRVLYDDAALYVGIRMFDAHPDSIAAQLARRDATSIYSDWAYVVIDTYHDRRNGFRFSVNPRGVQKDVLHSDDRNEDLNWDAVWESGASVDSLGWTAEFRIPFSQLRFGSAGKGVERLWGFQVQRDLARRAERDSWSPWQPKDPGFISMSGDLTGLTDIPTPRRMEVMPYVSTKLVRVPGVRANPFYSPNDFKPSVGADIKYGLPGGLTLTATVNPDFGQVEVDPAVVNLSAFESFFPEKRPFFVEGANIFNLGRFRGGPGYQFEQIFYSRRIGRAPQRFAGGQFRDTPEASTILGATKISGKSGPWTIGVLNAVTAKEEARVAEMDGTRTTAPVEPLTNYFISRIRREFNGGNTIISGGGTSVNRRVGDDFFRNLLRSRAQVGALEFEQQWDNRVWALTGTLATSTIGGSRKVITNAQRSSARYYQRPDADYLGVDPTRNSLTGHSASLGLTRSGTWSLGATAKQVSPGFEVNDVGFMGRVDYRNVGVFTGYNNTVPGKRLRNYNLGAGTNHAWNFGGDKIWTSTFASINATLTNLWYFGGGTEFSPSIVDDRLTRGGPAGRQPGYYGAYVYGGTDTRRRVAYSANASEFRNVDGGYNRNFNPGVDIRPTTSIRVSFEPGLSLRNDQAQYVTTIADSTAATTYGSRYVFAELRQTTLSASTRVAWTLTPGLSFQLFAQPLASVGRYQKFKELATPRTRDYNVFGQAGGSTITPQIDATTGLRTAYKIDSDGSGPARTFTIANPDFRTHSLRGNAVMRWEYRPGSALFFVWQQQRSAYQPFEGDFRIGRDVREIFSRPSNIFLVKATYWFAR